MKSVKFDVTRESSSMLGHEGPDPEPPHERAVFNQEENRWELEVKDLADFMSFVNDVGHPVIIIPGCDDCGDLPVLSILDLADDEANEMYSSGQFTIN